MTYDKLITVLVPYQELSGYYDKVVHRKALTPHVNEASSFLLRICIVYIIISIRKGVNMWNLMELALI